MPEKATADSYILPVGSTSGESIVAVHVHGELKLMSRDELEDLQDAMNHKAEKALGKSISHDELLAELGLS